MFRLTSAAAGVCALLSATALANQEPSVTSKPHPCLDAFLKCDGLIGKTPGEVAAVIGQPATSYEVRAHRIPLHGSSSRLKP